MFGFQSEHSCNYVPPSNCFFFQELPCLFTLKLVCISGDEAATHETRAEVNRKSGADAGLQLEDETFV